MSEPTRVRRYDRGSMRKKGRKDARGFLHVDAALTRAPAVFPYHVRQSDGSFKLIREFRPADHVFSEKNLDSVRGAPVTDEHPKVRVTNKNIRKFQAGTGDSNVRRDGDKMLSGLTITDSDLVEQMERGDKREVSLGYDCDLIFEPGVFVDDNGVEHPYDAIQTNHETNHIAIVVEGRAGPECAVHMDGSEALRTLDGYQELDDMAHADDTKNKQPVTREDFFELLGGSKDKARVTVDGVDMELPTAQATRIADAMAKRENDAREALAARDKMEAERDAAVKERDEAKTALDDAVKPEAIADAVKARRSLEDKAQPHFTKDEWTGKDGKPGMSQATDDALKVAVVKKANPDINLDEKSPEYIDAAFDLVKAPSGKGGKGIDVLSNGVHDVQDHDDTDTSDAQKRVNDAMERDENKWQDPVPGGMTIDGKTPVPKKSRKSSAA